MINRFIKNKHFRTVGAIFSADLVFFGLTNANKATTLQLFVGIALLLISSYFVVYSLLHAVNLYGVSIKSVKKIAIYSSSLFGLLIALQSMGQLSIKDIIILIPLSYIVYMYISYIGHRNQQLD